MGHLSPPCIERKQHLNTKEHKSQKNGHSTHRVNEMTSSSIDGEFDAKHIIITMHVYQMDTAGSQGCVKKLTTTLGWY